jgi:hypothetical protein
MTNEDTKTAAPPYISFKTFSNLLDRLESEGVPQHIDRHYWGGFLSGGVGQQLMAALKFLGLMHLETNEPTSLLEKLVDNEHRKATLQGLIRDSYGGVWDSGINLERTTPGHLLSAFGKIYGIEGETRRKAVTFFVHAAKLAEIPLSTQITTRTRQRRGSSTTGTKSRPKANPPVDQSPPPRKEDSNTGGQKNVQYADGPYAILHILLLQLPKEGRWTSERRERWFNALQANVDFLVSVEHDEGRDELDSYFEDDEDNAD